MATAAAAGASPMRVETRAASTVLATCSITLTRWSETRAAAGQKYRPPQSQSDRTHEGRTGPP